MPRANTPSRQAREIDTLEEQCQFLVLAEIRGEEILGSPLRLGQPSQDGTGSGSGSNEGGATSTSEEEA